MHFYFFIILPFCFQTGKTIGGWWGVEEWDTDSIQKNNMREFTRRPLSPSSVRGREMARKPISPRARRGDLEIFNFFLSATAHTHICIYFFF